LSWEAKRPMLSTVFPEDIEVLAPSGIMRLVGEFAGKKDELAGIAVPDCSAGAKDAEYLNTYILTKNVQLPRILLEIS